jgi:lipid-binding SYLF domain-containing protein
MTPRIVASTLLVALLTLCASAPALASREELDAKVRATVERMHRDVRAGEELSNRAEGMLVFPNVYKAGIGLGGAVGEGVLLINGEPVQYYRTTGLSFGFQLGGQARSEVILFMTPDALQGFRESNGWQAGVDGSVAVIEFGVGKGVDTRNVQDPIIGFIFDNKGLMYDLSLNGSKFWKISK